MGMANKVIQLKDGADNIYPIAVLSAAEKQDVLEECSFVGTHHCAITFTTSPVGGVGGLYHSIYTLPLSSVYTYTGVTLDSIDGQLASATPNIQKSDLTARIVNGYVLNVYASTSSVANNTYYCTFTLTATYNG